MVSCAMAFNLIRGSKLVTTALTVHPIKATAMRQAHCQAHCRTRMINQRRTRTPRRTIATRQVRTIN